MLKTWLNNINLGNGLIHAVKYYAAIKINSLKKINNPILIWCTITYVKNRRICYLLEANVRYLWEYTEETGNHGCSLGRDLREGDVLFTDALLYILYHVYLFSKRNSFQNRRVGTFLVSLVNCPWVKTLRALPRPED